MTFTVVLKRTHRLGNDTVLKKGTVIITSDSPEAAAIAALRDAADSKISPAIFGDAGLNDGEYQIEVLSITDSLFGKVTRSPSTFSWRS